MKTLKLIRVNNPGVSVTVAVDGVERDVSFSHLQCLTGAACGERNREQRMWLAVWKQANTQVVGGVTTTQGRNYL